MRAHHHGQRAVRQRGQDFFALRRFGAGGQHRHGYLEFFQDFLKGQVMLLGQNFRRGHERALIAVFRRQQHGRQRHQRFARAHVALQKPVHGAGGLQIGKDFINHFFLAVCKIKTQVFPKRRQQMFFDLIGVIFGGNVLLGALDAPGRGQQQKLFIGQPRPRVFQFGQAVWKVYRMQRLCAAQEFTLFGQGRRQYIRLAFRFCRRQGLMHILAHLLIGQAFGQPVYGRNAPRLPRAGRVGGRIILFHIYFIVKKIVAVFPPADDPYFGVHFKIFFKLGKRVKTEVAKRPPFKPGAFYLIVLRVAEKRLENQYRARRHRLRTQHTAFKHHQRRRVQPRIGGAFPPVLVGARVIMQQILDGKNFQPFKQFGLGRPDAF